MRYNELAIRQNEKKKPEFCVQQKSSAKRSLLLLQVVKIKQYKFFKMIMRIIRSINYFSTMIQKDCPTLLLYF